MKNLLNTVRTATARRVAYYNTLNELQSMPRETALDLGIAKEEARKIALNAVYGG